MELYDSKDMPPSSNPQLREVQERFANGEKVFSVFGRDQQRIKKKLGDYPCKSNCCYRAISPNTYELYRKNGFINDLRPNSKEYEEHVDEKNGKITYNNSGIDWYLGGAAPGALYGEIVIECPADKQYFRPSADNGCEMTLDPTVRHMKSSPKENPIPFSMITNVFDYKKIRDQENGAVVNGESQGPTITQVPLDEVKKMQEELGLVSPPPIIRRTKEQSTNENANEQNLAEERVNHIVE